tara:strand:- start:613 stop:3393 length:2781 start_codon:yes stop_codon:yes gene_type:complete
MLILPLSTNGQYQSPKYDIKVKLLITKKILQVSQTIEFKNLKSASLKELYFNDWSNAYSSSKSPLAQRFTEEYDRRFYLGSKGIRGETSDLIIWINNQKVSWERLGNQLDIIKIKLDNDLKYEGLITINLNYKIKMPNAKFTGYGAVSNNEFYLKNCFIQLAPFIDGKWITNSNLDLEETSSLPSDFYLEWNLPKDLNINSNLTQTDVTEYSERKFIKQSINKVKEIQFHISQKEYVFYSINGINIGTDMEEVIKEFLDPRPSLFKIESFITDYFGKFPQNKILLSKMDYMKRPYYGLTVIPSVLKPFNDIFKFEIKALSVFLNHYLTEQFLLDPRENFWLTGGLHSLLLMEFIDQYYPNQKFLGTIPNKPILKTFLKNHTLSEVNFNHSFLYSSEYTLRRNIQQASLTSKSNLIKFNERISQPAYVAHGIRYAYNFHTKNKIIEAFKNQIRKIKSKEQLINSLKKETNIDWFFEDYLNNRNSIDLKFKNIKSSKDSIIVSLKQNQTSIIPYTLAQVRNDSIFESIDILKPKKFSQIKLKKIDAEYVVINPKVKIPEFNQQNNYRKLGGTGLKPLKFTFVKDLENEKKSQVFLTPKIDFNAYDGLTFGTKLSNKAFEKKPFIYELNPNYSSRLNNIVGSIGFNYINYNEDSSIYLTQFGLFASSFHYNENLRYKIFVPSIIMIKRPKNLRSNKREALSLSYVSVNREFGTDVISTPNYKIGNLKYLYSNKEAIRFLKFGINLESSNLFGKINLNSEFRHLFHDGRSISLRIFAGKFLWNNTKDTSYFDYSLNRPSDYLFRYNYLGRSDNDGIYSQQFILSEGGFKSKFTNPNANDYILASNLGFSIWKWIEVYTDFGLTKNKNIKTNYFYDSGLRINLLPDYLEFYFPIQNSENYVLNDNNYFSNMRFVLTVDLNNLKQLFTRRWF